MKAKTLYINPHVTPTKDGFELIALKPWPNHGVTESVKLIRSSDILKLLVKAAKARGYRAGNGETIDSIILRETEAQFRSIGLLP